MDFANIQNGIWNDSFLLEVCRCYNVAWCVTAFKYSREVVCACVCVPVFLILHKLFENELSDRESWIRYRPIESHIVCAWIKNRLLLFISNAAKEYTTDCLISFGGSVVLEQSRQITGWKVSKSHSIIINQIWVTYRVYSSDVNLVNLSV